MKVLIYGMQSSGASLLAFFMAQKANTVGIIDLNNHRLAPSLDLPFDTVLKAVITTPWSLDQHINSFQPDRTILLVRNPYSNYYSLQGKVYASKSGDIDDKFALLDRYFAQRDRFDATIIYERFLTDRADTVAQMNAIGWVSHLTHYALPRTQVEITRFNNEHCRWCRENPAAAGPAGGWGMGNISGAAINPGLSEKPADPAIEKKVRELCPVLSAFYRNG
jgi:hypothetical protein